MASIAGVVREDPAIGIRRQLGENRARAAILITQPTRCTDRTGKIIGREIKRDAPAAATAAAGDVRVAALRGNRAAACQLAGIDLNATARTATASPADRDAIRSNHAINLQRPYNHEANNPAARTTTGKTAITAATAPSIGCGHGVIAAAA